MTSLDTKGPEDLIARAREEADYLEAQKSGPLSTPTTLRGLATALEARTAEVETLKREQAASAEAFLGLHKQLMDQRARAQAAEAKVATLEAILKPFADYAKANGWHKLSKRDLDQRELSMRSSSGEHADLTRRQFVDAIRARSALTKVTTP